MNTRVLLAVASMALCAGVYAGPRHQLTGPGFKNIAYFTQNVTLAGNLSTSLHVAPMTSSSAGFGLSKLSTPFPPGAVGAIATLLLPQPVEQGVALESAVALMAPNFQSFRPALNSWLVSQGIATAIVDYSQEILVSTPLGPVKKSIAFNARVDVNGRATYGDPKLIDPDPTVVEVTYSPLTSTLDLPAEWGFKDAGQLKWRMTTQKYVALSDWSLVNVGGAYDDTRSPNPADPEAIVGCLMDSRRTGCVPAMDVKTLMSKTGSSIALVSYVRSVEPAYTENADGSASSNFAMAVDSRTWDCTTYKNTGVYGMELALTSDRYLALPTGDDIKFTPMQQLTARAVSPTTSYDLSISATALAGRDPAAALLSPVPGETYWDQSDPVKVASLVAVAPLTLTGTCHVVPGGYSDVVAPPPPPPPPPPNSCPFWDNCTDPNGGAPPAPFNDGNS